MVEKERQTDPPLFPPSCPVHFTLTTLTPPDGMRTKFALPTSPAPRADQPLTKAGIHDAILCPTVSSAAAGPAAVAAAVGPAAAGPASLGPAALPPPSDLGQTEVELSALSANNPRQAPIGHPSQSVAQASLVPSVGPGWCPGSLDTAEAAEMMDRPVGDRFDQLAASDESEVFDGTPFPLLWALSLCPSLMLLNASPFISISHASQCFSFHLGAQPQDALARARTQASTHARNTVSLARAPTRPPTPARAHAITHGRARRRRTRLVGGSAGRGGRAAPAPSKRRRGRL